MQDRKEAAAWRLAALAGQLTAPQQQPSPCEAQRAREPAASCPGVTASDCAARQNDGAPRLLEGKVAIITGSGQGIGAAAARLFAQHGAAVVVSDLDRSKALAVADAVRATGGRAIAVAGDVTDPAFPARLVREAMTKFRRLDVLVNNAGFAWDAVVHKTSDAQWHAMLAVHCTAPFRLIQAAAPAMRDAAKAEKAASGAAAPRAIINVSSVSGTHGSAGQANYATAKAGVCGLTKAVAREWGQFNIRCNAVAYGKIATRMTAAKEEGATVQVRGQAVPVGIPRAVMAAGGRSDADALIPLGRVGSAEEAAGAMLLLASPLASYITGRVLEVDGGLYM